MRWHVLLGTVLLALALSVASGTSTSRKDAPLQPANVREVRDGDTVEAVLNDGQRVDVRYAGVSAPESDQCLGTEAAGANEDMVLQQDVWLETDPQGSGRNDRLAAYVWLDQDKNELVQAELVRDGIARLDPGPDVTDDPELFSTRHAEPIIDAQMAAAKDGLGWWAGCDPTRDADLVIASVKYWGDEEVVYVVNRGQAAINLGAGWRLRDSTESSRNTFRLNEIVGQSCELPSGGLLRIHAGHAVPEDQRETHSSCGQQDLDIHWTGAKIWNNDGDRARLFGPDGEVAHEYVYPPYDR